MNQGEHDRELESLACQFRALTPHPVTDYLPHANAVFSPWGEIDFMRILVESLRQTTAGELEPGDRFHVEDEPRILWRADVPITNKGLVQCRDADGHRVNLNVRFKVMRVVDAQCRTKTPSSPYNDGTCSECHCKQRGAHHRGCSALDIICVSCRGPAGWHDVHCTSRDEYRWFEDGETV